VEAFGILWPSTEAGGRAVVNCENGNTNVL